MYLGTNLDAIDSDLPRIVDKLKFLFGIRRLSVPLRPKYGVTVNATRFTVKDTALSEVNNVLAVMNEPKLTKTSFDVTGRSLHLGLKYDDQDLMLTHDVITIE